MSLIPRTTPAGSGDPFNDRQPFEALSINAYIAQGRAENMPDALTSLRLAWVSSHTPNREETERLLNRE